MLLLFSNYYIAEFYHVKIKSITYCKFSLAHSQRIQSLTPVMSEFLYLAVGLMEHFLEGIVPVDDRTEPKIPKFRCFGNFGSVRFGSVRLEKTEPKQIAEFRFKKYTVGKKIEKSLVQNLFH